MKKEARDCFVLAARDEKKGKKHKGLLIVKPDAKIAEEYIAKARVNLQLCDLYKLRVMTIRFLKNGFTPFTTALLLFCQNLGLKAGARDVLLLF